MFQAASVVNSVVVWIGDFYVETPLFTDEIIIHVLEYCVSNT